MEHAGDAVVTASEEVDEPVLAGALHERHSLLLRAEHPLIALCWFLELLLAFWCVIVAFGSVPEAAQDSAELPLLLFPLSVFDEGMMMFY